MHLRTLAAALAVLALLAATAPLVSTQAAEIGEGVEIRAADTPNGDYATVGDDGQVSIQLDADAAVPGEGLPADTLARFDRVLLIVNTNTAGDAEGRQAYVYVTTEGAAAEDFAFYRGSDVENSVEGEPNAVRLDTGESAAVGFSVDTADGAALGDVTLTVNADVSQLAEAILDVGGERPRAGQPVTFDATGSTGDDLAYTYEFGDGTLASDAGPTRDHTFSDPGTYDVTLTVEETAARAPNGSDTVTRQVVVRGQQRTGGPGEVIALPDAASGGAPGILSIQVDTVEPTDSDVIVGAIATESVADVADGNSPDGSSTVGAANVSLPDDPDADATITVAVDAAAVPAGTEPSDLALERYNGTGWQVLPTAVQGTSGGTITLVAETPGFSPFAVTVNPDAPTLTLGGGGGGGGGGGVAPDDGDDSLDDGTVTPTPAPGTDTPVPGTDTPAPGTDTPAPPTTGPEPEPPADTPDDVESTTPTQVPIEPGGFDLPPLLVVVVVLALAVTAGLLIRTRSE